MSPAHLDWDGCLNVRDLGGLPVAGGGEIRPGAIVRADSLHKLTASGWTALAAYGIRTVSDRPAQRRRARSRRGSQAV